MTYPNYTESGTFCWTNMSVVGGASHTWTKYCVLDSETTILAAEIIGGTAASDLVDYTHAAAGVNGTYVSPSITVAEEAVILCAFFGEGYFTANPSAPGWTLVCTFNGTQESVQGALFARHVDGAGSYSCTINTTGDSQAALMRLVAVTGAADVLIEAPWYTMA